MAAGAVAAGVAVHAAPLVTCILPLRKRLLPRLAGLGSPGHVALTFDDGPDPASTPEFLKALDRMGWKATFFMLGTMVRAAPGLAKDVAAAGHEVAVHGDVHRSHLYRWPGEVADDVDRATDTIIEHAGQQPRWFRPPYGELSAGSLRAARRRQLRPVLWTSWGRDWREGATPEMVAGDVAKGLGPGATVLLHDSDSSSARGSWKSSLGSLSALAELFAARDLEPGPLADHCL